jgi:hypothetical protein
MGEQQPTELATECAESSTDLLTCAECLKDYLDHEHGGQGKPFEVLRALTDMALERLRQGKDPQVTAFNLHVQVVGKDADERKSSGWLSGIWKTLEEKMSEREQGLQQYAAQKGLNFYPWPEKDKSPGGAGNTSYYFLRAKAINKYVIDETHVEPLGPDQIRYIRELTPKPAWWAKKLLAGGYALQGWRSWLLISYAAAIVLIVGLFLLAAWFAVGYSKNLTIATLFQMLLSVILVLWVGWSALKPYLGVFDWRITMAPDVLVAFQESNVQLELAREGGQGGVIRLVRYAGSCPVCGGRVLLTEGKKEFPNRLVGRCEESPAEHVYSFDRTTLIGKTLL